MYTVEYLNVGSVRERHKFSGKSQELETLPRCSVLKSESVSLEKQTKDLSRSTPETLRSARPLG